MGILQTPHDVTLESVLSTYFDRVNFNTPSQYFEYFAGESKDTFLSIMNDMDALWTASR